MRRLSFSLFITIYFSFGNVFFCLFFFLWKLLNDSVISVRSTMDSIGLDLWLYAAWICLVNRNSPIAAPSSRTVDVLWSLSSYGKCTVSLKIHHNVCLCVSVCVPYKYIFVYKCYTPSAISLLPLPPIVSVIKRETKEERYPTIVTNEQRRQIPSTE